MLNPTSLTAENFGIDPCRRRVCEQWLDAVAFEHELEPLSTAIKMHNEYHTATTLVRVTPSIYRIPTADLCFWSSFLVARLEKMAPQDLLILDDIAFEPDVFEILIQFMYTDRYVYRPRRLVLSDGIAIVYKVWAMAHKLGGVCNTLRNKCMEQVIADMASYYYDPRKLRDRPFYGDTEYVPLPHDFEWVMNNVEYSAPLPQLLIAALTQNGYQHVMESFAWIEILSRCTHLNDVLSERRLQIRCGIRSANLSTEWAIYLR